MKVSAIRPFTPVRNLPQATISNNNYIQEKDTFVKPKEVSFAGKTSFAEKIVPFVNDIYNYTMSAPVVSLERVAGIVEKHAPGVKVFNFEGSSANTNIIEQTGAYFKHVFNFNVEISKVIEGEQGIYLRKPAENTFVGRLEFLNNIVHEMSHVFQENSNDRVGKIDFIQDVLDANTSMKCKHDTIFSMLRVFAESEIEMQRPLLAALGKETNLPQPVNVLSSDVLNSIYERTVGCPVDNYILQAIVNSINKHSQIFPDMDKSTVLRYMMLVTGKENEAYKMSNYAMKSALSLKGPVDLDYRNLLYDRFYAVAENIEQKISM